MQRGTGSAALKYTPQLSGTLRRPRLSAWSATGLGKEGFAETHLLKPVAAETQHAHRPLGHHAGCIGGVGQQVALSKVLPRPQAEELQHQELEVRQG